MADSKNLVVLNLGSQRVGGAVFSRTSGGELVLKKFEFVEMQGDPSVDATRLPQLRVAVAELADRLKLKGTEAWYAVPGHAVFTRFVKPPPVGNDKIDQIVEFEARQNVPFPINEVSWDYEFVTNDQFGEREVLLAAMKLDALNDLDEQVTGASVKTDGVDIAPTALYNAFRFSYPEVNEACVIIDLGARSTNMVFSEDGRMFTRNILVGGATVTGAIAKDFNLGFGDAEQQKVSQGFIALGGTVEDHADAGIAALSKVIRQSMTRLHGEVLRTINYYRSQQGGGAPQRIFLAGGGAMMGFVAEFFQEKFKVPVEVFNALRGVQIGQGVNSDAAHQEAHCMGELVGLALRGAGKCPMELELVPDALGVARDAKMRKPAFIMAGLCLWGALGAGLVYVNKAKEAVQDSISKLQHKHDDLTHYGSLIKEQQEKLEDLKGQSAQVQSAVNDRSWWVRLYADLNNRLPNEYLWLTLVEPLRDGSSITPLQLAGGGQGITVTGDQSGLTAALFPPPAVYTAPAANATPQPSTGPGKLTLRIVGLYRKNDKDAAAEQVVYDFAGKLAESEFIDAPDIKDKLNDYCKAETGVSEDRHAFRFEIRVPIKNPMNFKK